MKIESVIDIALNYVEVDYISIKRYPAGYECQIGYIDGEGDQEYITGPLMPSVDESVIAALIRFPFPKEAHDED